jgi:hypothetical protein
VGRERTTGMVRKPRSRVHETNERNICHNGVFVVRKLEGLSASLSWETVSSRPIIQINMNTKQRLL